MPEIANGHIRFSHYGRIRAFIARWPQCTPIIKHFNIILNRLFCSVDFHIRCWKFPAITLVLEGEISYLAIFFLNGLRIFSPQLWTWRSMTNNIYDVYSVPDFFISLNFRNPSDWHPIPRKISSLSGFSISHR